MAREINRLSARRVATISEPGQHADGNGLYLVIDSKGRRWTFIYRFGGKRREMGLGPASSTSLAQARNLAEAARAKVRSGVDPVAERKAARKTQMLPVATTFGDIAEALMATHEKSWRNDAHRRQWRQTLEVQAASLWIAPVAAIDTKHVLEVLLPMWHTKAETARRIRGRIERVLDAARATQHRTGENPARWRGHLDAILPTVGKLQRGHHPAMPYNDVPAFYAKLCGRDGQSAFALRLAILTAARSGEVRGMVWGEVNMPSALWDIPADRMKAKRSHRVPLSEPVLTLLASLQPDEPGSDDLVFPSRRQTKLSDMALLMQLRHAGASEFTAHGFRTSFRTWADEKTDVPGHVAEAALAHLTGDDTERAYRRGDALEKRRLLMDQWAAFVTGCNPLT